MSWLPQYWNVTFWNVPYWEPSDDQLSADPDRHPDPDLTVFDDA